MPAALLLLSSPATSQLKTGDFSTSLNGTVSSGYTANYGNLTSSDHGWTAGGVVNASGSFYNPNFLSYTATAYLNQSRANSNFQSISNASGVDASTTIFGGSHFPGSVSYSKAYDSEGSYAVPGLANYVTHGNSDAFSINWSENLPDAPSVSAGFQKGGSQYSVYGANDGGSDTFHSVNLRSSYSLVGFNMGGYYTNGASHAVIPQVVAGTPNTETQADDDGYGLNVSHQLPVRGSLSTSFNRSGWNSNYLGSTSNGTIDILNSFASIRPLNKVAITGSVTYSDNLSGQLFQSILAAGGSIPGVNTNQSSTSLDMMGTAGYTPMANLQATASVERRTQLFLGQNYGVTSYGGSAIYSHPILNGSFNASLTATANAEDQGGQDTLGFSTNANYTSNIRGWDVTGSFGYAQNQETLLVTYMNSFYHYSGSARRRWGKLSVGGGAGASRTGLTQDPGTVSSTQSYNASVGYGPMITASGSYSKASGQALLTGGGLVPVQVPTLTSSQVMLYGGDSYSFALSSTPAKGFVLSADYAKSNSNTSGFGGSSTNQNAEMNALVLYQVRKLNFTSGFSRLAQGFSGSGSPTQIVSSYYLGLSRWFNFF